MSLRKLDKEKVCAKETIVLSFPVEKLKEHLTYTRFISPPFFYKAQAKQNHTEAIDSVIQSEMMHTSMRIPACASETERAPLPAQQGEDYPLNVSSAHKQGNLPYTQSWQGKMVQIPTRTWSWYWNQHFRAAGSAVRTPAPLSCSVLLLLKYSKSIQSHSVSLYAKAYSALKTSQHPLSTLLSVCPVMQKNRTMENDRSAKNSTSLYNKKEQCSSYISWILHCLKYFLQCLTTVSLFPHNQWATFPSHRSIQQNLKHIRKDWGILFMSPTRVCCLWGPAYQLEILCVFPHCKNQIL